MQLSFRWFGDSDAVTLAKIRQVPGVEGIVTSLHDRAPGEAWPFDAVTRVRDTVHEAGLTVTVIESIPVSEDIKLGRAGRDRAVDAWCESLQHVGEAGIGVVCYNFMPIFDWLRTDLARVMPDGSTTLAFDHEVLDAMDLSGGLRTLPAWADTYDGPALAALLAAYRALPDDALWEHLAWFLDRVVPVAESVGVKLALHPDDPPWPVLGVPRIVRDLAALQRVTSLVDRPANGITFCTGSLSASPGRDLPAMVRALEGRIHFAHCRNVKVTGHHCFVETPHPSRFGDVDMRAVLLALRETGFTGPMRPDHGRMIWGETGRAGYGLHDRALGAMYLQGLWEGLTPPS
ncbi:MAG: mannonate dehydratase [Cytophagaceae bacterium]|nr:mannonate dehydratase [Gemmatimonadaceae bacterium]